MLGSPVDIAIVAGIALILFGPKKFPEIGKAIGQGLGNFKRALHDAQEEVKTAVKVDDAATPAIKERKSSEGAEGTEETGSRVTSVATPCVASEVDGRRLQGTQQPERLQKDRLQKEEEKTSAG